MKNPLTSAEIEPATFRFVAQHLNHCATVVPMYIHVYNCMCMCVCYCHSEDLEFNLWSHLYANGGLHILEN